MYLAPWMIATLCFAFGVCALYSSRRGFYSGAAATLEALEKGRFIKVDEDGSVKRWTPYDDVPVKKTRKRK